MAQRYQPVTARRGVAAGWVAAVLLLCLALTPLVVLAGVITEGNTGLVFGDPYVVRVLRFTLLQGGLSALLSAGLAIPVTRSLARRQHFPGRELLLRFFAVPLGLPQLVAVLGIIAVYGRQGLINQTLLQAGLPQLPAVFGLGGILLAHVFFNLPLAVRFLLARLETIPAENWRLAASLGFSSSDMFRHLEWPYMRMALPGVAALIFMVCITSFTVVLTLGGGPQATTLEVAIYQALRFDFEPALAARLAGLQISLCALLLLLLQRFSLSVALAPRLRLKSVRPDVRASRGLVTDGAVILVAASFVLLPLAGVIIDGLAADYARLARDPQLWRAALWSMAIGTSAAALATLTAAFLARAIVRSSGSGAQGLRMIGNLVLLIPPIILAAGWFLLVYRHLDPIEFSPYAVILINALMALPFALAMLEPGFRASFQMHDRLADSLGLKGTKRFTLVEWPVLRSSLVLAFLIAFLAALGEFGVIAFFGNQELVTLPLFLYQRIGSYRFNDAAGIALVLLVLCVAISWLIERPPLPRSRA
jgi:thiamine transport system permease protein